MKIAIVLPMRFAFDVKRPNSIETVIRSLEQGRDDSDEVRVFCAPGAKARDDIPVTEVYGGKLRPVYVHKMVAALKAWGPDYIEFHQNAVSAHPIAAALKDIPCALYKHNYVKPPKGLLDRIRTRYRHRHFDSYIFVSESVRADFLKAFPEHAAVSHAVRNPIRAQDWHSDVAKRKTIIFAGRAAPEKGLAPLCGALDRVLTKQPDWNAVLVLGAYDTHRGWTEAQLAPLAAYGDRVRVLKNQTLDSVKKEMQAAAIAVVPSLWQEPFGLTALEALSAGCALVTSGRGGLREACEGHAVMVDEVTAETLAEALTGLIEVPDVRSKMTEDAYAYVTQAHTPAIRRAELYAVRQIIAGR